jgi:hypothetical protein
MEKCSQVGLKRIVETSLKAITDSRLQPWPGCHQIDVKDAIESVLSPVCISSASID